MDKLYFKNLSTVKGNKRILLILLCLINYSLFLNLAEKTHSKSGPAKNFKSFWIGQKLVNPSKGMLPLKIKKDVTPTR